MEKIKLLIFDYDGTIVYRESLTKVFQTVFSDLKMKEEIILYIKKNAPPNSRIRDVFIEVFNHFEISYDEKFLKKYLDRYLSYFKNGRINKDIINLFRRFSKRYKMVILSNGSKKLKEKELQNNGVLNLFEGVFTQDETGYRKPDSRAFKFFLDKYNLLPSEVVSIGDSFTSDMSPAKKLGMKTILIADFSADKVLSNLEKLNEDIISKL